MQSLIANTFNNFFIKIGPKLANDIPTVTRSFENYVQNTNETTREDPITINELKDAPFFPLKINKSAGCDEISFNVIRNCFGELCDPLKYIFNLSFEKGIFPADRMKIAKVTPVFTGHAVQILVITAQYMYFHVFPKFLND